MPALFTQGHLHTPRWGTGGVSDLALECSLDISLLESLSEAEDAGPDPPSGVSKDKMRY